ncbi:vWA domain-containing protein [Roseateles toxinivorans]|uniref:Ca-activated chloride channel family protein n=1 Tax=Roseateles toxinivorans TaxID=270368 RepID=A0A4R6QLH2_9BURK|nr:VWA domain-containing protein [Roseateles toxinivorans]TDP71339.1 Ca-activated chloride channel family protein [Roseateles toxinivorans]
MKFKWWMGVAALALVYVVVKKVGRSEAPVAAPAAVSAPAVAEAEFKVLATSDLRDVQPLEEMVKKATGVNLRFKFGGTMESTEAVLGGEAKADAAWFANAKYLLSSPQGQGRVKLQEKIMLSPIAVGVSESDAKKYGWDRADAKLTWSDIAAAARTGKLRYALSNPATSNQGFMALMGVVASAGGKAEALNAADVDRGAIADFLKGYKLPGDNSTYLSEQFILQQGTRVNAFINYESWLLSLNASGKLREKLHLIYPFEGVSTADYPFMLLDEARLADYLKVVDYLKSDAAQAWLARQTLRRPIKQDIAAKVEELLPRQGLQVELPFSPDRALADGLIAAYLNEFRTPIASTFVLDTSGSMAGGGRRDQLVQALHYIAGADASLTGRIAKLTNRERLWLQPFAENPYGLVRFELPAGKVGAKGVQEQADSEAKQAVLAEVRDKAERLRMKGGTALYDAVFESLQHMLAEREKSPGYQYSVVAFTDGENNQGRNLEAFKRDYAALPEDVRAIPVFMVLFGEANEADLKALVKITGGRVFDARSTPLYTVFKDIRAYQ